MALPGTTQHPTEKSVIQETTKAPMAEDSTTKITTASIATVTPSTVDSTTKIPTASITTVTPATAETSENVQTTTPDIQLKTTVSTSTSAKSTQKHQKSSLPQTTESLMSTKEEQPVTTIKQAGI